MLPMALEIFLPCYFGTVLSVTSSELSTAFFHSNWINESESFKKLSKMFFENAKSDMKITALGVFDVNLTTFNSILNSAYSLFAVLKRVQK